MATRAVSVAVAVAALGLVAVLLAASVPGAAAKVCTNTFPSSAAVASHTERAADQLRSASSEPDVLRLPGGLADHAHGHGHEQHLTPTDESAWMALMPRRLLAGGGSGSASPREEFDWLMLYRKLRGGGAGPAVDGPAGPFLSEASLHDVRLQPGTVYWQAQQTNLEYLLLLDSDSLVWSFRTQAGLQATGTAYGGWEGPSVELRGHFVGAPPRDLCPAHLHIAVARLG
jgi:hypothetical protein